MIALLAPLAVQVAAPSFAPPIDRPLSYTVREVRDDGTRTQRFAVDRRVTFRRAPDGYTAEVDTLTVTGDAGRAGQLFEAMARRMLGRRIVLHLDDAGKVVDVDDFDTIWDAHLAAVTGAFKGQDASRAALVDSLLAPLRALPRAAKVTRIGEIIAPLIAERVFTPIPPRTITLPAQGPDGRSELLAGTERISIQPNRRLLLERQASGTIAGTSRSVSLRRLIDPTGLVIDTTNIETIEAGPARLVITRSTIIAL